MTNQISYVALKPFAVQMPDGERRSLAAGDIIPSETHGRWLWLAEEAGKIAPVTIVEAKTDTPKRRTKTAA